MKSKIYNKFKNLKKINKTALITFITGGDPDLETTKKLILTLEKAGSDIIEIGIPYSDPLADGPVIQEASLRALQSGTTIKGIFNMVEEVRRQTQIPLVFLVYYNCIFQYGIDKFINDCERTGIDGLIIPDIPIEEREELTEKLLDKTVNLIPLVALTSEERIKKIVKGAEGFVYCISYLGVTGKNIKTETSGDLETDNPELYDLIKNVKSSTDMPKAVGFGISTVEDVRKYKNDFEGIIIGSAIIKKVKEGIEGGNIEQKVFDYVNEINQAMLN